MITDLTINSVTIAGTIVPRPSIYSPSQWMANWEKLLRKEKRNPYESMSE
jgi:hypothetical protein